MSVSRTSRQLLISLICDIRLVYIYVVVSLISHIIRRLLIVNSSDVLPASFLWAASILSLTCEYSISISFMCTICSSLSDHHVCVLDILAACSVPSLISVIIIRLIYIRLVLLRFHCQSLLPDSVLLFFFFFLILRRMGKYKALAQHTSMYFHTRRVSI